MYLSSQKRYSILFLIRCLNLIDLEWKIVYVGSAEDDRYDQTLDQIMVGPVPVGINRFVFQVLYFVRSKNILIYSQADAPDPRKIPPQDVLGVTVVLIICSYMEQEFVRIGYYVNNEYDDEVLKETPPEEIAYDRIVRNVLSDKPRVTRIPIKWDSMDEIGPPPEGSDAVEGEEMEIDGFDLPSHHSNFAPAANSAMELEVD